jgi:hypothetical protein
MFSKILGKSVTNYLNLDGETTQTKSVEEPIERKFETKKNYTWLIVLGLVGLGVYVYYKNRKH